MIDIQAFKARFGALAPHLNERARRLFAACEAHAAGRGAIAAVAEVTGVARSTIGRSWPCGIAYQRGRIVTPDLPPGDERKPKVEPEPGLLDALGDLVQSAIRGDPEVALQGAVLVGQASRQRRWRCGLGRPKRPALPRKPLSMPPVPHVLALTARIIIAAHLHGVG